MERISLKDIIQELKNLDQSRVTVQDLEELEKLGVIVTCRHGKLTHLVQENVTIVFNKYRW